MYDEEVLRLTENFSEGKAINENVIPTRISKVPLLVPEPILSRIFNEYINEGSYPDCLIVAHDIPVYKSGNQNICIVRRTISISLR